MIEGVNVTHRLLSTLFDDGRDLVIRWRYSGGIS
jgi:hypothetical protein